MVAYTLFITARMAGQVDRAEQPDWEVAVRLTAKAEALLEETGLALYPTDRQMAQKLYAAARARLGPPLLRRAPRRPSARSGRCDRPCRRVLNAMLLRQPRSRHAPEEEDTMPSRSRGRTGSSTRRRAVRYRPRSAGAGDRPQARGYRDAIALIQDRFGSAERDEREPVGGHELIRGDWDAQLVVEELRAQGFSAQPNHVLFADGCDCGPCAPWWHPAALYGSPFSGNALGGLPFSGNPFSGNPFSGNPFSGNPYPDPTFPGTRGSLYARTGRGRNLARPAPQPPERPRPEPSGKPGFAVLDTPFRPRRRHPPLLLDACDVGLPGMAVLPALSGVPTGPGVPDEDQDRYLDRIAGHGVFVAGRIASIAPACSLRVIGVLSNVGDGDEYTVAAALEALVGEADIVNLSMGGYALEGMACLASAVRRLQREPSPASAGRPGGRREDHGAVVVASAGNEAPARPRFPAGFPGS